MKFKTHFHKVSSTMVEKRINTDASPRRKEQTKQLSFPKLNFPFIDEGTVRVGLKTSKT